MKQFLSLLLLASVLAVGGGCCTSKIMAPRAFEQNAETNKNVIKQMQNATVALLRGSKGERETYCAGVWIDDKTILTAAHCVEMAGKSVLEIPTWEKHNPFGDVIIFANYSDVIEGANSDDVAWIGVVDRYDENRDLATIMALGNTSFHATVGIAEENVNVGQALHIMGHPVGMAWTYTKGHTSMIRKVIGPNGNEVKTTQVSAPIWFGNSGGGAFNSTGELIGICSWINVKAPNISFFIHKSEIADFLKEKKSFNSPI